MSDPVALVIPGRKCRTLPGTFTWPDVSRLNSSRDADAVPLAQLRDELRRFVGGRVMLSFDGAGQGRVVVRRDPAVKARIGFLPENPYFYDYLTGEEFLRFYGRLFGLNRHRRSSRRCPARPRRSHSSWKSAA